MNFTPYFSRVAAPTPDFWKQAFEKDPSDLTLQGHADELEERGDPTLPHVRDVHKSVYKRPTDPKSFKELDYYKPTGNFLPPGKVWIQKVSSPVSLGWRDEPTAYSFGCEGVYFHDGSKYKFRIRYMDAFIDNGVVKEIISGSHHTNIDIEPMEASWQGISRQRFVDRDPEALTDAMFGGYLRMQLFDDAKETLEGKKIQHFI